MKIHQNDKMELPTQEGSKMAPQMLDLFGADSCNPSCLVSSQVQGLDAQSQVPWMNALGAVHVEQIEGRLDLFDLVLWR